MSRVPCDVVSDLKHLGEDRGRTVWTATTITRIVRQREMWELFERYAWPKLTHIW